MTTTSCRDCRLDCCSRLRARRAAESARKPLPCTGPSLSLSASTAAGCIANQLTRQQKHFCVDCRDVHVSTTIAQVHR